MAGLHVLQFIVSVVSLFSTLSSIVFHVLSCILDLFSLNRFITIVQWYTTGAYIFDGIFVLIRIIFLNLLGSVLPSECSEIKGDNLTSGVNNIIPGLVYI